MDRSIHPQKVTLYLQRNPSIVNMQRIGLFSRCPLSLPDMTILITFFLIIKRKSVCGQPKKPTAPKKQHCAGNKRDTSWNVANAIKRAQICDWTQEGQLKDIIFCTLFKKKTRGLNKVLYFYIIVFVWFLVVMSKESMYQFLC